MKVGKMTRRLTVVIVAVVTLGATVELKRIWEAVLRSERTAPPMRASVQESKEPQLAPLCNKVIGEPAARVKVIAVLPVAVGCKDDIGLYLASVSRESPSMVSLRVVDMRSNQGTQVMNEYGIHCAAVLVNGKSKFDFGEEDRLLLEGAALSAADVRRALDAELRELYGDSAPQLPPAPAVE